MPVTPLIYFLCDNLAQMLKRFLGIASSVAMNQSSKATSQLCHDVTAKVMFVFTIHQVSHNCILSILIIPILVNV